MMMSRRTQTGNIWCIVADFIKFLGRQVNTGLMGNSSEMKYGVGRTADTHIHSNGIFKGLLGQNIPWFDVLLYQLQNTLTSTLGQKSACPCVSSRNSTISRESHAQGLSETVHSICSKQTGTGATARASNCLDSCHILLADFTSSKFACSLKGLADAYVLAMITAWQHRATAYNDTRNIKTGCCHKHTRNNLITVWNQNQSVKAGCHSHCLNGVSNQLTTGK